MTYTIIARCPRTGRVGLGIATYSIAVGRNCIGVRGTVGVTVTQAFVNPGNNPLALKLMAEGFSAPYVLTQLAANDPDFEFRQIGIADRDGKVAAHTGPRTRPWSGHKVGDGYAAFGNVLAGPQVVEAIAAGFEAEPDAALEHRLLRGLEGGRDAGGQVGGQGHLTERSACLVVASRSDITDVDLRVDLHETAIEELRSLYEEYQPYAAYYRERGMNPRGALPQEKFAAALKPQPA